MSKYKYSIFKTHFIQTMLYKEWHGKKKNHSLGLYPNFFFLIFKMIKKKISWKTEIQLKKINYDICNFIDTLYFKIKK